MVSELFSSALNVLYPDNIKLPMTSVKVALGDFAMSYFKSHYKS